MLDDPNDPGKCRYCTDSDQLHWSIPPGPELVANEVVKVLSEGTFSLSGISPSVGISPGTSSAKLSTTIAPVTTTSTCVQFSCSLETVAELKLIGCFQATRYKKGKKDQSNKSVL